MRDVSWQDLETKAQEAYYEGQLDDALDIYKKCADLASANDELEKLAEFHKSIGLILHDSGDYGASISALEESIRIQTMLVTSTTTTTTTAEAEAEAAAEAAASTTENTPITTATTTTTTTTTTTVMIDKDTIAAWHLGIANTYFNLAQVYRSMDELETSLQYLQKAMTIQTQYAAAATPPPLILAETFNLMGLILGEMENFQLALDLYTQCYEIRLLHCPNSLVTSCSASNIGLILHKMGKLESALFYLQRAMEIEVQLIPNTLDLADSFSNVGQVLFKLGRAEEALSHFEQALQIQVDLAPNSLEVSKTNFDLGWVRMNLDQLEKAHDHFQEAMDLQEHFIPNTDELAQTYASYMLCRKRQNLPIPPDLEKKVQNLLEVTKTTNVT
jgi:tetratricopeptide (TPR) repeat protein